MANAQDIANNVAKYFGGTPDAQAAKTPSSVPSPSGNGDAANAAFHKDLEGQICPDCHAAVKTVIPSPSNTPANLDPDKVKAVAGSMNKAFGN